MLEEGNKDDWFGSPLIVRLSVVAAIALALFIWIELTAARPLLNLRLLLRRNFGLGSIGNVIVGMALYGSVYLLPDYLSRMQGYNAQQVGEVLAWTALPQLMLIPFVPRLMRRFDGRLLVAIGLALFAASCFMNSDINQDYSRPAVPGAQPGARRGPGAGHDAALRAGDRRHRTREGQLRIGLVQHDAQPRRLDRHRNAADAADQARAVPLVGDHPVGVAC